MRKNMRNCSKFLWGILVLFFPLLLSAQGNGEFSGTVVDQSGEPIIGASVFIQGTQKGAITDLDGNFALTMSRGQNAVISYIGFEDKVINYQGQKDLRIVLSAATTALDEVVVVGYGSMKKKEMTSAISHVSSKDLNQVTSLDSRMLLQGKVSGVNVDNSQMADPNQQGSIQIRGVSSRQAGTGPLYVIDGVPGGDMTNINPADIESIDVLKDGAASAIYGTRGGNGVILVNLKKGSRDGSIHTQYSGSFTANVPKRELQLLTAKQFRAYRCADNPMADYGSSTDWFKASTRVGTSHMHTLTLSGGNAKTNYRVTADYRYATGVDLRSDRREYGARATANHTTKSGLFSFTANIAPRVIQKNNSVGFGSILQNNPTIPVYDDNSTNGYYQFAPGLPGSNVVEAATQVTSYDQVRVLEMSATAKINLLPLFTPNNQNFELNSLVTLSDHITDKFSNGYQPSTYSGQINAGTEGYASKSTSASSLVNLEWVTNFSMKLADHRVRLMAGYSYAYNVSESLSANNSNFTTDATLYNNLGEGAMAAEDGKVLMSSGKEDNTLISFFARVNYDWKERYLLSVSLRHEGSSRFGANHKWGNFPAASVAWRISDEPFFKGASKVVDDLKVRYDFGVTGNQDIGNYLSLSTYRSYGYWQYEGQRFHVWGPSGNVNPDLRWEKGYNQNVGIDFSFWGYRITGSINYFNRHQVDLLGTYSVPVPPNISGSIVANVGSMRNQGVELDLTVNPIRTDDFNWSFTLIGATSDNKFESFSNDIFQGQSYVSMCNMSNPNSPGALQRLEEGQRVGNYFTYRYAAIDSSGDWLVYASDGRIIPISLATEADKRVTGNGLPWFTGSLTNNFKYKEFDLSFSLRTALGFEIFNVHDFYYGLQCMNTNLLRSAYAKNAAITTGANVLTDYFLEPGDYLKLDQICLGWTHNFDLKFIEKIRVFATASNLYTLTRFTGIDPSVYPVNGMTPGTFGGNASYYPSAFQFVFGVQVGF
ncbi:MAG: SusC/RagA family TonB-linked outer membrane protein [Bacteroidales bacterium]|nr:SusC/RagA family TonB-linked outer membrane protein [Bacteroidales bacterium]